MIYDHNLEPAIFKLGMIQPRWYALMYIFGFICSYFLISRHPKFIALGKSKDDAMDFLTYAFVGVLGGGRVGYILFYNLANYIDHPLDIFKIWMGGMSFHGGLIGSILAITLYARQKKISLKTMFDIAALPTPVGLMFGRLGNFINGELWGKPTDSSWGVRFHEPTFNPATRIYESQYGPPRHPTQLYEAGLEGLLLFGMLWLATYYGKKLKPGSIGALFLLGYGCARFGVEFCRLPDPQIGYLYGGWLTMGHALSLPMILGGLIMLIYVNRKSARTFSEELALRPVEANVAPAASVDEVSTAQHASTAGMTETPTNDSTLNVRPADRLPDQP